MGQLQEGSVAIETVFLTILHSKWSNLYEVFAI